MEVDLALEVVANEGQDPAEDPAGIILKWKRNGFEPHALSLREVEKIEHSIFDLVPVILVWWNLLPGRLCWEFWLDSREVMFEFGAILD